MAARLDRSFFQRNPLACAQELLGCELVWGKCAGVIVETELYGVVNDEACHTFSRAGARAFVEKHPAGTAYVYVNYGIHWLLNVLVKGGTEEGIILIRALEPTRGIPVMAQRRGTNVLTALCSGPGKLGQALGITGQDHERDLCGGGPCHFRTRTEPVEVVTDVRIGITKAADFPWRFLVKDHPCVSVKPKLARR